MTDTKRFNPVTGIPGVRLYIEGEFGEYKMNGDVDRNIKLQKCHEDLMIKVIEEMVNVPYVVAKSVYSIAYYYGHEHGIDVVDKYIEASIQVLIVSRV